MSTKKTQKTVKAAAPEIPAAVPKVQIIPLGGLDRIGMNITAIRYEDEIIVVDCGVAFPDEDQLGIDKIIPDVTYLIDHADMVKGFFITHGHEDHIGAIPYILPQINAPIYATKLTMGLIENKLEEAGVSDLAEKKVLRQGSVVRLKNIKVEFIKTNHSIAGTSSLAITTPAGVIFHTGDFKVDYTPLFGDTINLQRIAEIGSQGVLAVLSDSTNAMRPGFTPSERLVAKTFENLFAESTSSRIIVATYASNIDRVQQLLNTAKKFGRKVILQGRSMETVIDIAAKLGCVKIPSNTMIDVSEMDNYPDNKLVFITTGSQGEGMAALTRMANGTHRRISIKPGDVIVFSSNPIPGNERAVSRVANELVRKGAVIRYQDTPHVSGHACQQELQLIYTLLKPKYAIPVHGEFRHLLAASELCAGLGIPKENIFILQNGDVLELSEEGGRVIDQVPARGVYVDGLGIGDVGNVVIHDRQILSESGIIMAAVTMEEGTCNVLAGPEIITRGFVYIKESGALMDELRALVNGVIMDCAEQQILDRAKIRNEIRYELETFLRDRYMRTPMILPLIMDA